MGGFGTDGAEHCPDLVVINHADGVVGGRTPNSGIFRRPGSRCGAVLPVVVIVVSDEPERFDAITTAGISLVNCHVRAVQHASAERLVGMIVEWRKKTDADLAQVFEIGIWNVTRGPVVLDQVLIELVVRSRELGERTQVLRSEE